MNAKSLEMLVNPPCDARIVYSYTEESQVAEAVGVFAIAGIRKNEAILLLMTEAHYDPILRRLRSGGLDVDALTASGQLVCETAESLLSSFMVGGIIDEMICESKLGGLIGKAKASVEGRSVRVFAEMVSLIWQSRLGATERLERLWNEMIRKHTVPLLCAYAMAGNGMDALPVALRKCHSHHLDSRESTSSAGVP